MGTCVLENLCAWEPVQLRTRACSVAVASDCKQVPQHTRCRTALHMLCRKWSDLCFCGHSCMLRTLFCEQVRDAGGHLKIEPKAVSHAEGTNMVRSSCSHSHLESTCVQHASLYSARRAARCA